MNIESKPLAEITSRAIEVLSRELGPSDAIRFMKQFTSGRGDYTRERDFLFEGATLDQIIAEIERARGRQSGEPLATEGV